MEIIMEWFIDNFGWTMLIGMSVVVSIGMVIVKLQDKWWERYHAKRESEEATGSEESWRMFTDL